MEKTSTFENIPPQFFCPETGPPGPIVSRNSSTHRGSGLQNFGPEKFLGPKREKVSLPKVHFWLKLLFLAEIMVGFQYGILFINNPSLFKHDFIAAHT